MPETKKLLRWEETTTSEPSGFNGVVHTLTRVVEGEGPIPKGGKATDAEPHDWKLKENP